MRSSLLAVLGVGLALPAAAGAQQWRTIETARQLTDSQPLTVAIKYAAGKLEISPIEEPYLLYQMRLRYDEQTMEALHVYDRSKHELDLGLSNANVGWRALKNAHDHDGGSMAIGLSPAVPMDLQVELGGVEADLELGGLRIRRLALETGMAGGKIDFSEPNHVPMDRLSIDLGLGAVKIEDLGNANVGEIVINGGLGGVSLDFGDDMTRDVKITSDVALGGLAISVPPDVGVLVQGDTKGGEFDRHIAFVRKGNDWYSMNWNEASHRVTIVSKTTLGKLKVGMSGR